uniref:Uncharacterized protein n=1 Tax=Knipowitschia caucasica TaxID=637954 RepID=A0AAV2M4B4_KNICA
MFFFFLLHKAGQSSSTWYQTSSPPWYQTVLLPLVPDSPLPLSRQNSVVDLLMPRSARHSHRFHTQDEREMKSVRLGGGGGGGGRGPPPLLPPFCSATCDTRPQPGTAAGLELMGF